MWRAGVYLAKSQGPLPASLKSLEFVYRPIRKRAYRENSYCERVIGTIQQACTDRVLVLNERHPKAVLREYVVYYNEARTRTFLERPTAPTPASRPTEMPRG